jgi:hypothetical protein
LKDGSVVACGTFINGAITIAGTTIDPDEDTDGFIAHYSNSGDPLGAVHIGGTANAFVSSITAIDDGYIVVGSTDGHVDFDKTSAAGDYIGAGAFVARYSADGAFMWGGLLAGASDAVSACATGNDQILVAGRFEGTVTLGLSVLTTNGLHDIFVARLDGTGNVLSARAIGSAGEDSSPFVMTAGDASIVVGESRGDTRFPDGTLRTGFGQQDAFIYQW